MSQTSSVIELLEQRASVRDFDSRELDETVVQQVLQAAQHAPTSSNLQAYSFIVVRDPAVRERLAELTGNQNHVKVAPVFVAVCADLNRLSQACEIHANQLYVDNLEIGLVASVDAALAGMCASLAADSLGLGSIMIGGIRNNPEAVAELLGLPPRVFVLFGLCLGYPASRPAAKPRIATEAVIHQERYDGSKAVSGVTDYDQALADYYQLKSGSVQEFSWSQRIAETFSRPHREHLRAVLNKFGLKLE